MAFGEAVNINKILHLPNMVLATTYAINKSNSKRVAVGLEYNGGFFKPSVKICSAGSPVKYVTLDPMSWEALLDNVDIMEAYLSQHYGFAQEFGTPTTVYLSSHNIQFTESFGVRAILIHERQITNPPNITDVQAEQAAENVSDPKKRKIDNPPGVIMQTPTFIGFKQVRECVNEHLINLEKKVVMVNRVYDFIVKYLKKDLEKEEQNKIKSVLKDDSVFKQYYARVKNDLIDELKINFDYGLFDESFLNMILCEMNAFILPIVAFDLKQVMLTDENRV